MKLNLHILVNCTERKRATIPTDLCLRSVPFNGDIKLRAKSWWQTLGKAFDRDLPRIPAIDLYAGEHWSVVKQLPAIAQSAGFNTHLWVISAGYGLINVNAPIHPYSATFASTAQDAVIPKTEALGTRKVWLNEWWEEICNFNGFLSDKRRSLFTLISSDPFAYYMIVGSPDYIQAIEQDLLRAISFASDESKIVIVSSQRSFAQATLNKYLVSSDARLLTKLGGTRGSLNARVASMILQTSAPNRFDAVTFRNQLEAAISSSPELTKYERTKMLDDDVKAFISAELEDKPDASCSVLLRKLRGNGFACEQHRFKNLYWGLRNSRYEE